MRKFLGAVAALVASLILAGAAAAAPVDPLTDGVFGGELPCVKNATTQVTQCSGPGGSPSAATGNNAVANTVPSFDGTPIDINLALPDPAQFGPGPYPLAMYFHGFGGGKEGFGGDLKRFTDMGVAAFSMTERGFKFSCGKKEAVTALEADTPGACDNGYIHLMDMRYEVRDAQYFAGLLADEGLIVPDRIGSVGASYGGGKSANLAVLKNRIMLPDGSLAPWKSPDGKDMSIAVTAPVVPWTDFAYSLVPNGTTLDYTVRNDYGARNGDGTFDLARTKFGTAKAGIITGLFPSGDNFSGDFPDLGFTPTPSWDIRAWKDLMFDGDPFDQGIAGTMLNEMTRHHSSYYVDGSVEPAPMLVTQGLVDDLFPPDEAVRLYNRVKTQWPDSAFGILMADIGHPRSPLAGAYEQGRPEDQDFALDRAVQWFSHYLLDEGPKPAEGVAVKTQVCPYSSPSGGPHTATSWAALTPGEIRTFKAGRETIKASGGSETVAGKFIDVFDACVQTTETKEPGTVQIDFPVTPAGGFTLGGSPTVTADISVANGPTSQIAARLFEISGGKERLIARTVYRPDKSGRQVFQLHANAYRFEPGTRARLQLLPRDGHKSPDARAFDYVMPSNDQRDVTISNIDVRLPVMEKPGSLKGLVKKPLAKPVPNGRQLMRDYAKIGGVRITGAATAAKTGSAKGRTLTVKVTCSKASYCAAGKVTVKGKGKLKGVVATGKTPALAQGVSKQAGLKLTAKARKAFRDTRKRKGLKKGAATVTVKGGGQTASSKLTVKRTGKVR